MCSLVLPGCKACTVVVQTGSHAHTRAAASPAVLLLQPVGRIVLFSTWQGRHVGKQLATAQARVRAGNRARSCTSRSQRKGAAVQQRGQRARAEAPAGQRASVPDPGPAQPRYVCCLCACSHCAFDLNCKRPTRMRRGTSRQMSQIQDLHSRGARIQFDRSCRWQGTAGNTCRGQLALSTFNSISHLWCS